MDTCSHPLNPGSGETPLDGIAHVRDILSFLEEQATSMVDMQAAAPYTQYVLSPRGVVGQVALYTMLRDTLDHAVMRIEPH